MWKACISQVLLNQAQDIQLLRPLDGLNVSVTHVLRGQSDTETAPDARSKG